MSRRRKNAGEGYGYVFSGAFTEKKDAVKKERARKGSFIKGIPTPRGYRYVVMTPRDNPRRAPKKRYAGQNPRDYMLLRDATGAYAWEIPSGLADRLGIPHAHRWGHASNRRMAIAAAKAALKEHSIRGGQSNPMDLVVMGAGNPSPREITIQPGQTITFRMNPGPAVNPSGAVCGKMIGGYPCMREPGHRGPHLRQGATLRPQSRHNWGKRRNPPADELRAAFVGVPADRITTFRESHMPEGKYALLGRLLCLYVKPLAGGQVLMIKGRGVQIVSAESARQIWFVGGDQDVSQALAAFGAVEEGQDVYELGAATRIDYKQRKEHVPDPDTDEWRHEFGEENGIRPRVYFDAHYRRLLLRDGDYRIEARGIIN